MLAICFTAQACSTSQAVVGQALPALTRLAAAATGAKAVSAPCSPSSQSFSCGMHTARRSSQAHTHEDEYSDLTLAQAVQRRMELLGLSPSTPEQRRASASGADSHGPVPTFAAHSDTQPFTIMDGHMRFPNAEQQQQQQQIEDDHEPSFLVRHGGASSAPASFLLPHTSRGSTLSLATLCSPGSFGWAGPHLMSFGAFGSSLSGGFSAGLRSLQQNTERAATRFRPADSAAASSSAAAFSPSREPASHHSDASSSEHSSEDGEDSSYASIRQEAAAEDLRQGAKHLTLGEAMQAMRHRREPADVDSMAASS